MKKALFLSSVVVSGYATVFAQTVTNPQQVQTSPLLQLLDLAQTVVSRLSPLLVGLALVAFFWFLINFIWFAKDKPEDQQKYLKGIWMSVLAMFVMVSIWGIVGAIGSFTGVGQGGQIPVPGVRNN